MRTTNGMYDMPRSECFPTRPRGYLPAMNSHSLFTIPVPLPHLSPVSFTSIGNAIRSIQTMQRALSGFYRNVGNDLASVITSVIYRHERPYEHTRVPELRYRWPIIGLAYDSCYPRDTKIRTSQTASALFLPLWSARSRLDYQWISDMRSSNQGPVEEFPEGGGLVVVMD